MEDGQWYRVTSGDKIAFDHYRKKWVLKSMAKLINGIIDETGKQGMFSENEFIVYLNSKKTSVRTSMCLNEEIAVKLGYEECISDGMFYLTTEITDSERRGWFTKKDIPQNERSKSYNLESDPDRKKELQDAYDKLKIKIDPSSKNIAKHIGDFTIGMEAEVINGFIPKRVRAIYGIKALKDGSLRHDKGEGIEYVTVVMKGAKGVELIRKFCSELKKRCEINNLCSLHFHFGNVRKDKTYVLSLYSLVQKLQDEIQGYFPYSRFNTIKSDGKVYCKKLIDLSVNHKSILSSKTEDEFRVNVVNEFNKVYAWLNHGKNLGEAYGDITLTRQNTVIDGKKMFCDKWLRNIYTTKSVYHSVQGNKWDKAERYYMVNFLNLFFTRTNTIEFRCHEGTTNSTKCLIWLLTCASILKYADNIKDCFKKPKITLKEVLLFNLGPELSNYIISYFEMRRGLFFESTGEYKSNYKSIENNWFSNDSDFTFKKGNIEIK